MDANVVGPAKMYLCFEMKRHCVMFKTLTITFCEYLCNWDLLAKWKWKVIFKHEYQIMEYIFS